MLQVKAYYPSINILRGIAALMVCLYHFTNYADLNGSLFEEGSVIQETGEFGVLGVFVFFVITGFVIPLTLIKHKFRLTQIHRFFAKRWVRIEIPYLASILLVLLVGLMFSIKNDLPFIVEGERLFHHVFYTTSFFDFEWYNPIYWTLAIEIQFYILIALLFPLFTTSNKWLNCIIPLVLAIAPLIVEDNRLVFHYCAIFSQGLCLLLMIHDKLDKSVGAIIIAIALGITGYSIGIDIAIVAGITLAIIAFFSIDNKGLNRLGDISYSLYLTHGVTGVNLIYFVGRYSNSTIMSLGITILALLLSIMGAFAFWKYVEAPSQKVSKGIKMHKENES